MQTEKGMAIAHARNADKRMLDFYSDWEMKTEKRIYCHSLFSSPFHLNVRPFITYSSSCAVQCVPDRIKNWSAKRGQDSVAWHQIRAFSMVLLRMLIFR